jgi:filamentous hemagglutinin
VAIDRDPSGRIVFLETGNPNAGLEHILRKKHQFSQPGVGENQVADYVFTAVTKGKVVGMQRTRPVYEFQWNGGTHRLAVTVGNNGFIVGANPVG